jgi:membrane-bound lytic murein transglycosylase F
MREATRTGILSALSLLLVNCSSDNRVGALPHPDETGVLIVSTRNGPTTFYTDRYEQPNGPEYDLVKQFAREALPLLADKRYYLQLRYGYARGYEPVHFVQRVRNYRDVISVAFQ